MSTQLSQSFLDSFFTGVNTRFKDGLQKATSTYKKIATPLNSTSAIQKYPILEQFPQMREWVGPRFASKVEAKVLEVSNKSYESTLRVNRDDMADDQYALYGSQAEGLGRAAENLWDDLLFKCLTSNPAWVDGADFFGTTRKYGKNVISNKTTTALSVTTFEAAYAAMRGYVGAEGTPLQAKPTQLIVGPALEATARKIVECSTIVESGAAVDNPWFKSVELIVDARLSGTTKNYWYLVAGEEPIPAIIIQKREEPTLTRMDKPESDCVFKNNENLYGTRARGAAALVMPHLIYAGIVAA